MNSRVKLKQINTLSRFSLAFILIYQGLIPKILWLDDTELLLVELHSFQYPAQVISLVAGIFEVLLGLIIVFFKTSKLILYFTILLFSLLLIDVALVQPQLFIKAFNPITINISSIALSFTALFSSSKY